MRHFGKIVLLTSLISFAIFDANAQMSDQQIITYVKEAKKAGKTDEQLGRELVARGVSREQLEQIKQRYEKKQLNNNQKYNIQESETNRLRTPNNYSYYDFILNDSIPTEKKDSLPEKDLKEIFGHNIFKNKELSFEPNENMATPIDYILGPGDEVIIDIWGANEASIRQTISPEGQIIVSQIGPIYPSPYTHDGHPGEYPPRPGSCPSGSPRTVPDCRPPKERLPPARYPARYPPPPGRAVADGNFRNG